MIREKRNISQIFTLVVLILSLSFFLNNVKAEKALITKEEINSTEIYSKFRDSVLDIENHVKRDFLLPGDEQYVMSSGIYLGNNNVLVTFDSIENSDAVFITDSSKKRYRGFIKSSDKFTNIAILGIYGKVSIKPIKIYNNINLVLGQTLYSIGNNSNISGFMSDGTVGKIIDGATVEREDGIGSGIRQYIMSSLPIIDGGSGSPVFDTSGNLVGVVDFYALPDRQFTGIYTLVLPSTELASIVSELIKYGRIDRPSIGVNFRDLSSLSRLALKTLKIDKIQGVLVTKVSKNGFGDKIGIKGTLEDQNGELRLPLGDIIVAIDDKKVSTVSKLERYISFKRKGDIISFDVFRNGKIIKIKGKIN